MGAQRISRYRETCLATLIIALAAATSSHAQFEEGGIGGFFGGNDDAQVTIVAQFTPASDDKPAVLMVTADVAFDWHIYPLKLDSSVGLPTKITLEESSEFRAIGSFAATPEPVVHEKNVSGRRIKVPEYAGQVTFYVPIEFAEGVDPAAVTIHGSVNLLVCKDEGQCVPQNLPFEAKLGEGAPIGELNMEAPASAAPAVENAPPLSGDVSVGTYRAKNSEVTWTGWLEPAQVTPGGTTTLYFKGEPTAGWHLYALGTEIPKLGNMPTVIVVTHPAGLQVFEAQTTAKVITKDHSDIDFGIVRQHEGAVTWSVPIKVPDSVKPGKYVVGGLLGYQTCEDNDRSCEPPKGVQFQVPVEVAATFSESAAQPVSFAPSEFSAVAAALKGEKPLRGMPTNPAGEAQLSAGPAYDLTKVKVELIDGSLLFYLGLAFLGGLVLNLMPCVLPVIGLKVMSFVEQAGHNRTKALTLNLWYAAGIVAVFLVLAGVAVSSSYSWGGQSSSTLFNVLLVSLVFAMALSLLGVWEIPIPGFIGSGSIQTQAAKEGVIGAFLKGMVTTILAIPCTGPFMATALGWAIDKPALTTIQVFAAMGFGMASPYVLVGVYPQLLRFLPKPGAWMETFKQAMGFVLMATVVFILSYMDAPAVVPTVALLGGIALACWLYSRTSVLADFNDRAQTWALCGAVVAGSALFAFGYLYQHVMLPRFDQRVAMLAATTADGRLQLLKDELTGVTDEAGVQNAILRVDSRIAAESGGDWQPFSLERLGQVNVEEGKTVLVDFSAEWCVSCKSLEQTVLHTEPVEEAIRAGNVVTMYGDFTKMPPEIDRTLRTLGSTGVPVIAVFPGNDPYNPIVFRGLYTKSDIIGAIEEANSRKAEGRAEVVQASAGMTGR